MDSISFEIVSHKRPQTSASPSVISMTCDQGAKDGRPKSLTILRAEPVYSKCLRSITLQTLPASPRSSSVDPHDKYISILYVSPSSSDSSSTGSWSETSSPRSDRDSLTNEVFVPPMSPIYPTETSRAFISNTFYQ